jgi:hypothetical protein
MAAQGLPASHLPPGLGLCTTEKTVMVRPQEPPRSALADEAAAVATNSLQSELA